MRTIVTGGAGFIGRHLAERLVAIGHEVTIWDIVNPCLSHPNITFFQRDVTWSLPDALRHYIGRYDWMFHLAARADVIPSIQQPLEYHEVNVGGTVNMLQAALGLGVKKFIYASSTSIYGIPGDYPTPETAPPRPEYPYSLTKWVAEEYVMHWGKVYGLPVTALRITTAYGPGMKSKGAYGSVFKVFLAQRANNKPFTIVGNGEQSRDFVFVSDVVDAFIKAAESDIAGEVFNVGSGQPTKVNDLVRLLSAPSVLYLPKRPGEPDVTWADISKIKQRLGWQPQVSIHDGVRVMLNHLDDWKSEPVWTPETIQEATREWFHYLK